MPHEVDNPQFWDQKYINKEDMWELQAPAPPLKSFLEQNNLPRGKVAVLGCGRGHDAELFAKHGHETWGFDFSETAIRDAKKLYSESTGIHFEQRDVFTLGKDYKSFFDVVWEYTCFCAIDPSRRNEYVTVVKNIHKPNGKFIALFYPVRDGEGGPPFPTTLSEIDRLFSSVFTTISFTPAENSIERRKGFEHFFHAVLK